MEDFEDVAQDHNEIEDPNILLNPKIKAISVEPQPKINSIECSLKNISTLRSENTNIR